MKAPSLVVAGDGTQVAMIEEGRVTVIDLATMRARCEIGLAGTAADSDVALAGVPSRLVVVTRMPAETRLFVVDPAGPEKLGEATTRPNMRLGAVAADSVLLIGATTALVDLRNLDRPPATLPVRGAVMAAGPMGDSRMVLVMAGVLEEWDASTRAPVKRMRLDRPLDLQVIGGSERRIWMVMKAAPQRIEVMNSQTKSTRVIEVPEPIERLHVHPYVDVLLAIGATSAFVVRTDRDQVTRVPGGPFHDCVWAGNQIVAWPVDSYPQLIASPIELKDAAGADADADEVEPGSATAAEIEQIPVDVRAEVASQNLRSALAQPTFSERLASWRAKLDESRGAATPAAPDTTADTAANMFERRSIGGWRGEIATWVRAVLGRSHRPLPFLDPPVLDALVARFELGPDARAAIVLLYGAHLIGERGVSRYDVASAIDWRWDALGDGAIATCPLVRIKRDRFTLLREASAALDEAPPRRGTLLGAGSTASADGTGSATEGRSAGLADGRIVGSTAADGRIAGTATEGRIAGSVAADGIAGSTSLARTALVAPASVDAHALATWGETHAHAPLFVANSRGLARIDRFLLEARIRGAVPVVPDDATASAHGLSVAARWPGLGVA